CTSLHISEARSPTTRSAKAGDLGDLGDLAPRKRNISAASRAHGWTGNPTADVGRESRHPLDTLFPICPFSQYGRPRTGSVLIPPSARNDVHQRDAPAAPAPTAPLHVRGAVPRRTAAPVRTRVAPARHRRRTEPPRRLPHLRPARNADPH